MEKNHKEINKIWTMTDVEAIYVQPFNELLYTAHSIHREYHDPNIVQTATLLSIKTGACPEDCGYCSQSGHHSTYVEKENLMSIADVIDKAIAAKNAGAKRFCMGAAWRSPPQKALPQLQQMITAVKALGLETCMTLGMLDKMQAQTLKDAGLDYYNHNIDTAPSYYEKVVTTRKFSDRLTTLDNVRDAGINVCCGGILGLGETYIERIEFLLTLANMQPQPSSVPINRLIPVAGTPLAKSEPVDDFDIVRTIATARVLLPQSVIRLTAGRTTMSDELQALCFFVGANSVFIGSQLLTAKNPDHEHDQKLFEKLGINQSTITPHSLRAATCSRHPEDA